MNLLCLLLTPALSFAYIPEYSLLATHAADQHGRGAYLIEQDVTFRKDSDALTVKETWLVLDEHHMRVTLEGRGPLKGIVQGTLVFDGSHKYFIDSSGARNQRLGEDWLEPLFHFRNPKYFRSRLVSLKVTPNESLTDRPPLSISDDKRSGDDKPNYQAPNFIHLARVGGDVSWAIGVPAGRATLWLEQDQFVLRKYRSGDQLAVRADDYMKFDQGFWYPRKVSYTFGPYAVDINTLQVRSLGKLRPDDVRFKSSGLNVSRDALRLPEAEALKEFYSRFR
jgi:hypothetical protein